ncbi:hypothetical protein a20_258 [Escherichia phage a20]|nr:hypothetical protein a20_258 [Escherichia phage a20]
MGRRSKIISQNSLHKDDGVLLSSYQINDLKEIK